MNDFLKKIIAERRQDVRKAEKEIALAALQKIAKSRGHPRSLIARLRSSPDGNRANIIAEIKRASPSEGKLRPDLNPAKLAREYEDAGAAAISILTEPRYFQGKDSDLQEVRKAVKIPILRKDFTVDPWQVYQSAALGADIVLLIVAALESSLLKELYHAANEANLETIIEIHTLPELGTALHFPKAIIGVNSRNLTTLKTDISTAIVLAGAIPKERISIAESGIKSRREAEMLMKLGYRGFLIGTSLLKAKSPGAALAKLVGAT
ncbi:MAG: indole-3-glycerol phosphate synthase TrpC [Kiritimatiellia bacterium]|nr:indole-3-glycerol phosphate synthase TrpC [Kiritimatiellia bacterium]